VAHLIRTLCRFEADFKLVKRKGTIVSFGNASGTVPPVPLSKLTEKNVKLMRPTCVRAVPATWHRAD
jgi:NADPH2:quinone reductase